MDKVTTEKMYIAERLYAFALFDYVSMHSILKKSQKSTVN